MKNRIIHSHSIKEGRSFIHNFFHIYNKFFEKQFANNYFACSDLAARWLYTREQYEEKNFKIINNGIETERFIFNDYTRNEKREEFGIKDKFVIGHIGRFVNAKNHEFIIDIFLLLTLFLPK